MPIIQPIDLTKPKLDWRWLLTFLLIVIVCALVIGIALWISNAIKTTLLGPAGSKHRIEERRI